MLYGCPDITLYTVHKNNTFQTIQTQQVICWRLFLEDYRVKLQYIKGKTNHVANALSHLPFNEQQGSPNGPDSTSNSLDVFFSMAIDNNAMLNCFLNLPPDSRVPFVLDYQMIHNAQAGDALLEVAC